MAEPKVRIHPKGICADVCFRRNGPFLEATAYMAVHGHPEVMNFRVDLREIALAMQSQAKVSGIFDDIVKGAKSAAGSFGGAVESVGKSKIVSAVGSAVKTVARSKVTGGVILAASVACPAVGLPAAAAYAATNKALDAIETAKKVSDQVKKIAKNPKANPKATANLRLPAIKKQIASVMAKAKQAKITFGAVGKAAKNGNQEAMKAAQIVNIVAAHRFRLSPAGAAHLGPIAAANAAKTSAMIAARAKVQQTSVPLKGTVPGFMITPRGKIVKGKFHDDPKAKVSMVLHGGKVHRGRYAKVGLETDSTFAADDARLDGPAYYPVEVSA